MIPEKKLEEIREYLKKTKKPLFLFDDDPDGLTSYLLLKKYCDKGKGIPLKSSPKIDERYIHKINWFSPDYLFILDKPIISQDFVDLVEPRIIWIDHHPVINVDGVKYYNPLINDPKDNRPVSYWCYKTTKQHMWIAICGIIGDWHIPDFFNEFCEKYSDLVGKAIEDPGYMLFETKLGKLIKIFAFSLKGKTNDVKRCINVLEKIDDPYELLNNTTSRARLVNKHFESINKKYQKIYEKALTNIDKSNLFVFIYPSSFHSFTGELANEILYHYPDKFIIVGREKEGEIIMSLRWKNNILPILNKALEKVNGKGGGHENACGSKVSAEDFNIFIEEIRSLIK